jgi:hypothetical protein
MTRVVLGLTHLTAVEFVAMPALETRARIAAAFEATRRLLARQSRGTMRPRQNSQTRYMT